MVWGWQGISGAFQYLVKPVDEQKFAEVFCRAVGQIISEAEQRKKKLVIQYGGEGKAIPLNDIYYMESRNHNIIPYLKSGNIDHRGYLINLFHVEGYDGTEVRMANMDGSFRHEKRKKGWHCRSHVTAGGGEN